MTEFTIEKFTYSEAAKKLKIDNQPDDTTTNNIEEFIENLLKFIAKGWSDFCTKNKLGSDNININSGYRCSKLNTAVGGSKTSAHLSGYAVDIVPANGCMKEFQTYITDFVKDKEFDQLIYERPHNGVASWIHIGFRHPKNGEQRRQIFTLI